LFGNKAGSVIAILECESGYNTKAKNPLSTASGLMQYLSGTWRADRKRMGRDQDLNLRFDWIENLETTKYTESHSGLNPWVSSINCHNKR